VPIREGWDVTSGGLVDFHAHFLTDRYLAEARAAGITNPDGMPGWPTWSADAHLALMAESGIAKAFLSISSPGVHFGDTRAARLLAGHVNDEASRIQQSDPERFGFFAALPLPDVGAAVVEAVRAIDELGAAGVSMLTHHNGLYLGDPALEPLWDALNSRATVVHVHPTSPPGWERLPDRPRPMLEFLFETARSFIDLLLAEVPKRHSRVRFVAAHCGGALPLVIERAERFSQAFLTGGEPLGLREQLARIWFDTAGTPLPDQLPSLVSVVGEGRILYGSDYCFTPPPAVAGQLASLNASPPASDSSWAALTTRNAARCLA